jgi:hypothetical protein
VIPTLCSIIVQDLVVVLVGNFHDFFHGPALEGCPPDELNGRTVILFEMVLVVVASSCELEHDAGGLAA